MRKTILVTGGAGYIGSHTCLELMGAGFDVVVFDNLSNSKRAAIARIGQIVGRPLELVVGDLRDGAALDAVFARHAIDAVLHFAGLKAVGESVSEPLRYYDNNVGGTVSLLHAMQRAACTRLVFSSSATVYGDAGTCPITEDFPIRPTNPYGSSKAMIERILIDLTQSDSRWKVALLRYFNPVGAHESGLIGEDPDGIPNNLAPFVAQVAIGRLKLLTVHGQDYPTRDGTGERDYIHVVDLAQGHLAALNALGRLPGAVPVNLGTGHGTTVLELVRAFSLAARRDIPYVIGPRRAGDIASCFADPTRAFELLGWRAERDVERMCIDTWRWQEKNPHGLPDDPR